MSKVRGNSEVKAMRRTLQPLVAATAGLALFLAGCSGESPTSPKPPTNGGDGGGACAVTIALDATSVTPMAGTAVILRATVRKGGALVPDGTAVLFTTDFGFFLETGLPSVSKVTQNGFADVTLGATSSGLSKVKAAFECGTAETSIEYQPVPSNGPFVSSIEPISGSCAGGDTVTINGGRFGTDVEAVRVVFGGRPASIQTLTDTRIVVLTPSRTLANPQVPEVVDLLIQFFAGDIPTGNVTVSRAFTYYCVDPNKRLTLSAVSPSSGSPDGGQQVVITGNNFLPSATSSVATTRVTFGGAAASVTNVTNTEITALTPRHILANPAVPETVDVAVTADLGLVSQQSGLLPQAFTYRSDGGAGACTGAPGLFIATVQPEDPTNAGSPDGGDIVVVSGGGFTAGGSSTTLDRTDVFFGGVQGVTLSVSDGEIRVTTPRRVLSSPDRPETVDVKVIADAGGPKEACVQSVGAYTYYPGGFLEPVITSISPATGPNDANTRVTIFGRNFKLPMQVFVRSGGVDYEAAVVEIKASQIIFLTPMATGPNNALAGQTVDVVVRDPYAGKEFVSPVRFRYYSCPSINSVVPSSGTWDQPTVVTIAGQNFEEPVEISFAADGYQIRPTVTSVSSSLITIVMPAIDPAAGAGSAACTNIEGTLNLSFPSLDAATCEPLEATYVYRVEPMTAVSATPTQLNQAGAPAGTPLTDPPATISVIGSNFTDPMTVQLIKDGAVVTSTSVNNAIVANGSLLSFSAPAIPDSALNTQICSADGTTLAGTRYVPTSFGIRLRNARTGCTVDLPNVLIYNPADTTCRTTLALSGVGVTTGTLCQNYGPVTFTASGGTPPYVFTTTPALPQYGLTITPGATSVSVSATPLRLQTSGPALTNPTPVAFSFTVTDSLAATAQATYTLNITDPASPFTATAGKTTLAATTNPSSDNTTVSATSPFAPVSYAAATPTPVLPAGVTFTLNTATGLATLSQAGANTGSSTVVITAADAGCGGTRHESTVTLTLNY